MTRLESMFGAPALIFVKEELKRRGLDTMDMSGKVDGTGKKDIIHVEDEVTGGEIELNISAATANEGEFRKALDLTLFMRVKEISL